jgi:molybdopterin-guanine dinucleotide biosynthesis protein A
VRTAGVVLAGGRSRRMGTDKAALRWGTTTLLAHVCARVAEAVDGPVIVVGAPGQEPPALPAGVRYAADATEGGGPLVGILAGLVAATDEADAVYVSAVDMPHLRPAFVRRVLQGLDETTDVVLPEAHGFRHPLAAAYRTALAGPLGEIVTAGGFKPAELYAVVRTRVVGPEWLLADPVLQAQDPDLDSLLNVNDPAAYAAAHAVAFPP